MKKEDNFRILEKPKWTIESLYNLKVNQASDINEHLPVLKHYTEQCDHVTEFGVRWVVSTYAFMMGKPKVLRSYDLEPIENYGIDSDYLKFLAYHNGIDFQFSVGNTLTLDIEKTDLLFIDTLHTYGQLKRELEIHNSKVNKFMILHDTETFGLNGENGEVGLWPAVEEFLNMNLNWVLEKRYTNNNGLTILKRIN